MWCCGEETRRRWKVRNERSADGFANGGAVLFDRAFTFVRAQIERRPGGQTERNCSRPSVGWRRGGCARRGAGDLAALDEGTEQREEWISASAYEREWRIRVRGREAENGAR